MRFDPLKRREFIKLLGGAGVRAQTNASMGLRNMN
jgi:hypothetical protein